VLIRMVISEYLRECGLQVIEAASGLIRVLSEGEVTVDLVFTDVQMPGLVDGWLMALNSRAGFEPTDPTCQ